MKAYTASIEINASAETVWAILTDGAGYTLWDPGMHTLDGTIAPGEKLTIHTKLDPNRAFTPTVADFEPPHRMIWRSGMPLGLFKGERTFTLEPLAEGGIRFTLHEVFSGPMMVLIGGSIPDLTSTFEAFCAGLKDHAESRS